VTKRSPGVVVMLTLLTFTLYAYYWLYATTEELRRESGRRDLSGAADVLLTFATFGVWGIWAGFRNARLAHELHLERGLDHTDRSLAIGGFAAFGLFTGWAWLVAIVLLQEDLNGLTAPVDYFASSETQRERAPRVARMRVEPEPVVQPAAADTEWERGQVFQSSAPAPIVY
jgi:hypothetical protein